MSNIFPLLPRPHDPAAARVIADRLLPETEISAAETIIRRAISPAATPLHSLPALAASLKVGRISYKDEGQRLPLKSFKLLGGAFAVWQLLTRKIEAATGHPADPEKLLAGEYRALTEDAVMTCATDGNHGRAVAWAAQKFGAKSVIFVGEAVSQGRVDAIAAWGADVRRVKGVYEDAVAAAAAKAADGWFVVSDTAYPGCEQVPQWVMQGYGVLADEIIDALPQPPSHLFLQCGVGGMAGAVTARVRQRWGDAPIIIIVEPEAADCAYQSARAGVMTPASGTLDTICAGLACGEMSTLAWDMLSVGADAFQTFTEAQALTAMKRLNRPLPGDETIVAGECAGAGLAALTAAAENPDARRLLRLDEFAHIVIIGTEGDTDPVLHRVLLES